MVVHDKVFQCLFQLHSSKVIPVPSQLVFCYNFLYFSQLPVRDYIYNLITYSSTEQGYAGSTEEIGYCINLFDLIIEPTNLPYVFVTSMWTQREKKLPFLASSSFSTKIIKFFRSIYQIYPFHVLNLSQVLNIKPLFIFTYIKTY